MLLGNRSKCLGSAVSVATLGLLLAPVANAIDEGARLTAGPFQLLLQLDAQVRYDDNIFTDERDGESSLITEVTPGFRLLKEDGVNSTSLGYALNAGFYASSSDDNYFDSLFDATSHMEFSRRSQLDLKGEVLLGHDDRGSEFSKTDPTAIAEPDRYRTITLAADYGYGAENAQGRFVLGAEYLNKNYTNHRDTSAGRDRDNMGVSGTFFYRLMPKTRALFELKYKDIDYDEADTLDSTNSSYRVGLTWETTAKTTGTVKVGLAQKDFDDPVRKDFDGFSWEASVQWAPQTYSVFDLTTSRSAEEGNGTGDFIDNETLSLGWTHAWNQRLSSRVSASLSIDDFNGDPQQDDLTSYAVKLDYLFHRNVSFSGGLNWNEMDSSATDQSYEQAVLFVGVETKL
ncbi:MAG: outer membrane beta-barrel protein [Motiliproteus sp.]